MVTFAPGDEVFGYVRRDDVQWGTAAELVPAPQRCLWHKPQSLSFAEAGARGVEIANHFSAFVAGGTPAAVVEQLNAVLHKALADPRLQKNFSEMALEVSPSTPQELRAMVRDDSEKYGAVIRRLNLSID